MDLDETWNLSEGSVHTRTKNSVE